MTGTGGNIGSDEFRQRLAALCIGGSAGLPKRGRDLQILLASATLWMEPGAIYTEPEVNEGLSRWLETGCPSLAIDVVTLRRELVDRLYLDRDDSGTHYSPGAGPVAWSFDDEVADIDPSAVIADALAERAERKAAHQRNDE